MSTDAFKAMLEKSLRDVDNDRVKEQEEAKKRAIVRQKIERERAEERRLAPLRKLDELITTMGATRTVSNFIHASIAEVEGHGITYEPKPILGYVAILVVHPSAYVLQGFNYKHGEFGEHDRRAKWYKMQHITAFSHIVLMPYDDGFDTLDVVCERVVIASFAKPTAMPYIDPNNGAFITLPADMNKAREILREHLIEVYGITTN